MGADKSKFGPELMGGVRLADRLSDFLSSLLDIGRSVRVRISRLVNPDYDSTLDILRKRDVILGHTFNEYMQRAPKFVTEKEEREVRTPLGGVGEIIRQLEDSIMDDGAGCTGAGDRDAVPEASDDDYMVVKPSGIDLTGTESNAAAVSPTSSTAVERDACIPLPDPEAVSDVSDADDRCEMFPQIKGGISVEVVDVVADVMSTIDDWIIDSGEIFEDIREYEIVSNAMSICVHDRIIEQMKLDDPSYGPFVDVAPVFPEARPSHRQMTLDIETGDVFTEEVPWYTDADLISIGVQAATEDFIESNMELWETFEPIREEVVEEDDPEGYLVDMAVKAMSEDAIEQTVVRFAHECHVPGLPAAEPVAALSAAPETIAIPASEPVPALNPSPETLSIEAAEPVAALSAPSETLSIEASESVAALSAPSETIAIPASEPVPALNPSPETLSTEAAEPVCPISDPVLDDGAEGTDDIVPAADVCIPETQDAAVADVPEVRNATTVRFCFGTGAACAGGSAVRFGFGVRSYR
ncbi:MAG: hypothetical protein ACI4Q9_04770 [Candidatus Methanomethylophilaceae archaeon]